MYLVSILVDVSAGRRLRHADPHELLSPGQDHHGQPDMYNQMFTLHGAVMIFLFLIPGIPAALGNFVLPIMLGAKDVAFPRLNLASFYLWWGGAMFFLIVLATGGLDTGWTFYTPYSTTTGTRVVAGRRRRVSSSASARSSPG